ncbi:MAG: serine/threonine protein kinase, partial [Planctomycetes bacterium]|nr:serine/threonine protein kinase [Planctomycetota bacterium]
MAARDPLAEAMALMSAEPAPAPALAPAADPPAPPPAAGAAAVLTPDGVHGELSGRSWAGFAVGDLLGSGGMGEVYRAWQGSVGRAVALKVLHARSHDPVQRQRFIAEARAAGRVRSPQVVAVYDSGEQDGRLWLALEVVDGPTLAEELGRRRTAGGGFTPAETLRLMLQAASGLAAVHRARMVHRDLKPGNLLLDRDGGLHLGDFGLVRLLDERSLTLTGTVVGTPQYMAPEQGRGHAPSARADIYSLGAVMYELLTLRPPFSGTSADQLISQHNFTEPEPPGALAPGTPPELEAVCLTCLQKDPARRFADGTSLADDLARIHAGIAPVSTVRAHGRILTGADEAVRRLAGRRRQYLLASALLALLGLGLAGGWWWWDQRKVAVATLRDRLAPLLQPAAAPPTAGDDLDRLQTLAGPGDPLVASGRAKLAAVEAAAARLTALEGRPEPDPAAAGAALAALEALVGP